MLQPLNVASGNPVFNVSSLSVNHHFYITMKLLTVLLLTVIMGCESDAAKLQRLQGEQASQCLLAESLNGQLALGMNQQPGKGRDSLLAAWNEHYTKCQLAQRDLNRFMR